MSLFRSAPYCGRFLPLCLVLSITLIARASQATTPSPPNCVVDPLVVGNASGAAIGAPEPGFSVVVRDFLNIPVAGSVVTLDFVGTPIRLQTTQNPGTTVDCVRHTLTRLSDASGVALFAPRFGGFVNTNSVSVSADGLILAFVMARSTDLDALEGRTALGDFQMFADNLLNHPSAPETDFDGSGTTALGDFRIMAEELLGNGQGAYCP